MSGRAFLALLIRPEGNAVTKLTETYQRWTKAKHFLGPPLEILPWLLIIPLGLFIAGLLSTLFSRSNLSPPTWVGAVVGLVVIVIVGVLVCCAFVHSVMFPGTSPFQSTLSRYLQPDVLSEESSLDEERDLTADSCEVFHMAIQETFEDEALDQASAALKGVLRNSSSHTGLELQTIVHLLSPEASSRCNLSAARTILDYPLNPSKYLLYIHVDTILTLFITAQR